MLTGAELVGIDQELTLGPRPGGREDRSSAPRASARRSSSSRPSATTRRPTRSRAPRPAPSSATTAAARTRPRPARRSSKGGGRRRASTTSSRSSPTRSSATRSSALPLDVRLCRALGRCSRSRSGSSSRSCSTRAGSACGRTQRSLLVIPYAIPAFLGGARLGRHAERRLRAHQHQARPRRAVAVRRKLGEGVVPPRQLLARLPVLLPRLHRSAAGDPRGAQRGRARRRRRRACRCSAR